MDIRELASPRDSAEPGLEWADDRERAAIQAENGLRPYATVTGRAIIARVRAVTEHDGPKAA